MAKNKSSEMPHYELLYIISNKFSENEVPAIKESIDKLITDNQGQITFFQNWGKKKLAYPIKHFRHGYYQLVEFDMPAEAVKKVDNNLRLSDQILRHQIVKKIKGEAKPGLAEVTAAQEAEAEAEAEVEEQAEEKPEATTEIKPAEAKETAQPAETKPAKKEAVKMEDLDDKLDKILDSESFF